MKMKCYSWPHRIQIVIQMFSLLVNLVVLHLIIKKAKIIYILNSKIQTYQIKIKISLVNFLKL